MSREDAVKQAEQLYPEADLRYATGFIASRNGVVMISFSDGGVLVIHDPGDIQTLMGVCGQAITNLTQVDHEDPELPELPPWAVRKATGDYFEIGARLPTRDGRRIGNAVVLSVDGESASIITDKYTRFRFNRVEIQQYFHEPDWIVCEVLSTKVRKALEGKS